MCDEEVIIIISDSVKSFANETLVAMFIVVWHSADVSPMSVVFA